ncbi:MAG: cell division protein ZapA [Rhizomicrobium sp.]
MPLVDVTVNDRVYSIACDEGQEAHLKELAGHVDGKVRELTATVGQVSDQKLMLMAAVLIADEFFEARNRGEGHAKKARELSGAEAAFDARIANAEMRASDAVREAEARAAQAVETAGKHAAEIEEHAAQAVADAESRIADAEARATDAEARAAQTAIEAPRARE